MMSASSSAIFKKVSQGIASVLEKHYHIVSEYIASTNMREELLPPDWLPRIRSYGLGLTSGREGYRNAWHNFTALLRYSKGGMKIPMNLYHERGPINQHIAVPGRI